MKGEILLKTTYVNATIVTMNEQNEVIENGYIIVENDQIIDVKSGEFANDFEVDEVIDMKGKWVLPGLVNTHTHVVMSLLRGIGDDMLLQPWLETRIWPLESQFTPELAVASTELGLLEMVKVVQHLSLICLIQLSRSRCNYGNGIKERDASCCFKNFI